MWMSSHDHFEPCRNEHRLAVAVEALRSEAREKAARRSTKKDAPTEVDQTVELTATVNTYDKTVRIFHVASLTSIT